MQMDLAGFGFGWLGMLIGQVARKPCVACDGI